MSKIFQPAYNLKISVSDGRTQVGSRTLSVHLTSEYVSTQSDKKSYLSFALPLSPICHDVGDMEKPHYELSYAMHDLYDSYKIARKSYDFIVYYFVC